MKITNKHNLPPLLVQALTWKKQKYCDYSVTELLKAPQMLALEKKHDADIEVDVIDSTWAFFGSAMHYVLERLAKNQDILSEEKLIIEVDGKKIGGQPDIYYKESDGKWILADLKTTSAWSAKFEPAGKSEWHKQTNIYAYMLAKHGFPVDKIMIWQVLRDWSAREAQKEKEYPQSPIIITEIPLRPPEKIEALLKSLIKKHVSAEIPSCTDEERWARPTTWAVMLPKRVRAAKVCDTKESAEAHAKTLVGATIVERPGAATRCDRYCNVSKFCPQYNKSSLREEVEKIVFNEYEQEKC